MSDPTTRWAPIPGSDGYEVSEDGRLRALARVVMRSNGNPLPLPDREIKTRPALGNGYLYARIVFSGKKKSVFVHRAVAEAFIGPRPPGMLVLHNDGNKNNNHVGNLRYGTYTDNLNDAVKHGTHHNASKTHCRRGHEFTPENTYVRPGGGRRNCRTCDQDRRRREVHS